jgi:WD40 repeat protein
MRTATPRRSLRSSVVGLWKALTFRSRVAIVLFALVASVGGGWFIHQRWAAWPTRAVLRTPSDTWPLAFSPDSRTFATSGERGSITLWEADSGRQRATWNVDPSRGAVAGVFSPDGRTFAAALFNHPQPLSFSLVDVDTGRTRATLPARHTGVYNLAFADDGKTLRAFIGDVPDLKEVVLWDASTGEELSSRPLTCPTAACDTAISPDGHLMALVPYNRRANAVRIWDLDADRELVKLSDPSSPGSLGRGLGFSGDSQILAIGREDGAIEIWDLPTRRLRMTLRGHTRDYQPWWIKFAPDGRTLASHGGFRRPSSFTDSLRIGLAQQVLGRTWRPPPEVIVLDIATGKRLARAESALHPYYSPDGRTIATREMDFSVRLRVVPIPPSP